MPETEGISKTAKAAKEIIGFWQEAGPEAWYKQDDAFDQEIRDLFGPLWEAAQEGACETWPVNAEGALAAIILFDQFPRNMFRGDPRSFQTDPTAKAIACKAIDRNWDLKIEEPMRQFFYMPFMHSEQMTDQDHCVRLMAARMSGTNNLLHARVHREIIRKFARFPYRNDALGRDSRTDEETFLEGGGYGEILRKLEEKDAAAG